MEHFSVIRANEYLGAHTSRCGKFVGSLFTGVIFPRAASVPVGKISPR